MGIRKHLHWVLEEKRGKGTREGEGEVDGMGDVLGKVDESAEEIDGRE